MNRWNSAGGKAAGGALAAAAFALFVWCVLRFAWILPFGTPAERSHGLISLLLSSSLLGASLLVRRLLSLLARAPYRLILPAAPAPRPAARRAVGE